MKGQIEIIGLVVVVLLIVVGGIMFLKLSVLSSDVDLSIKDSIEVNNMRSALLKTTICDITVEDSIIECYNRGSLCEEDACEYSKRKIVEILDVSLPSSKDFKMVIKADEVVLFELGGCGRLGVSASPSQIIDRGVSYVIDYKMCDKNV